jgi:hypothetical protein
MAEHEMEDGPRYELGPLELPEQDLYVEGPQELRVTRAWALGVAAETLTTKEAKSPLTSASTNLPFVEDVLAVAQWIVDGTMPESES